MLFVIFGDVALPFQPVPPETNHQGPNRHGSHIEGKGYVFAQRLTSVKQLYRYKDNHYPSTLRMLSIMAFFLLLYIPGPRQEDELRGPKFPAALSSPISPVEGTGKFVPRP